MSFDLPKVVYAPVPDEHFLFGIIGLPHSIAKINVDDYIFDLFVNPLISIPKFSGQPDLKILDH